MGWKNVKDYYRINHIVKESEEALTIGSGYIPEIIVFSKTTGKFLKRYEAGLNEDLARYQAEMDSDLGMLSDLIEAPDTLKTSIPVFTYENGQILEKFCEEPGWPNVTHDGILMYDNQFSTDKAQVIEWAKNDARLGVKFAKEEVSRLALLVEEAKARLTENEAIEARYAADHPA